MKNSPHHKKHEQHKAMREALYPQPKTRNNLTNNMLGFKYSLMPLNVKRCTTILHLYKKHLEQARVLKHPKDVLQKTCTKYAVHWQAPDLERSKRIARKMLKQTPQGYKKAA